MILIFEGVDCSGKSTIIDKFVNKYNFKKFFHNEELRKPFNYNYYDKYAVSAFYGAMNATLLSACEVFDNFVIDRFHISECVYSRKRIELFPYAKIINYLSSLNKKIITVYCYCNYQDYLKRMKLRTNENFELTECDFLSIQDDYETALELDFLDNIKLNTSEMNISETFKYLDEQYKKYK